jgi:hypothetical protein
MRKTINGNDRKDKKEYVTLERQRKLIKDDLEENNIHRSFEHAYARVMINRVKIPQQLSSKERNIKKHIQEDFKRDLINFFDVEETQEGQKFLYCWITKRWWKSEEVKAAHIVPKVLESEELSLLFWRRGNELI